MAFRQIKEILPAVDIPNKLSDKTICMSVEQECRPGQKCKHYDVHNLYGWSQSEPTFEANLVATGSRPFVISRSTYPGSGKYVGHWLGDNNADWGALRYSIVGMLEFNLFGIPFVSKTHTVHVFNWKRKVLNRLSDHSDVLSLSPLCRLEQTYVDFSTNLAKNSALGGCNSVLSILTREITMEIITR